MRYINGGRPTPRDEMRDDYLPWWLAYYDRGDAWGFWAAIERETGTFLGWFHLRPKGGPARRARARVPADPAGVGQGNRHRGIACPVDKAFAELGAARVYASTMAVNEGYTKEDRPKTRVARAGTAHTGTAR